MINRLRSVFAVALVAALGACTSTTPSTQGSTTPSESATPTTTPSEVASPTLAAECRGAPKLPAGFPTITGVTFTSSRKAGPTTTVIGSAARGLTPVFNQMKAAFTTCGFVETKTEKDAHDAEVVFAGNGVSGQVKLGEDTPGRTNVTVTIRPA